MLTRDDIKIPKTWTIMSAGDTGTYMGGLVAAVTPAALPDIFVLDEFPNYHYVGDGTPELNGITVQEWMKWFGHGIRYWSKKRRNDVWFDANTTFKTEMGYGIVPRMNRRDLDLRTEITREYMRHGRVWLAPWLKILPFELQEAAFPQDATVGGRYVRIKRKDHILDGLEHICSRRPHPELVLEKPKKQRGIDILRSSFAKSGPSVRRIDPHLGVN